MRDLIVFDLPFCSKKVVVSSDCSASIGGEENDVVKVDPFLVGKFGTRVAVFEVLCVGAEPYALVSGISAEKHAERIIEGIKSEAKGLKIFGSTEKNFPTKTTFFSVFCIGFADELRVGRSNPGDYVVAVGTPSVGYEVVENENDLPDVKTVRKLLEIANDLIPTGSGGVKKEIEVLESETSLEFEMLNENFPYEKSCGPSSVVLATVPESRIEECRKLGKPVQVLGRLV